MQIPDQSSAGRACELVGTDFIPDLGAALREIVACDTLIVSSMIQDSEPSF
jgi:hypothetical protein